MNIIQKTQMDEQVDEKSLNLTAARAEIRRVRKDRDAYRSLQGKTQREMGELLRERLQIISNKEDIIESLKAKVGYLHQVISDLSDISAKTLPKNDY